MSQKGIREDRKKVDEAIRNRKISMAVSLNFSALPRFITYLEESGVTDLLAELNVQKERKCHEHMEVFPLLYLAKFLAGIKSTRGTREMLVNKALLTLIGFTDKEIKKGLTERGSTNQYGEGYERKSGVVAEPVIIDNISAFDSKEMMGIFDKYIRGLVDSGLFEMGDTYILDSTLIETNEGYPGAGKVIRQEKQKDGSMDEKVIHGFKVFVLMDAKTKIPVAMDVTPAQKADSTHLKEMVEKGFKNLGGRHMKLLVADRGFIDGEQMWQIKNDLHIDFIIPARKTMEVWKDVVGLRKDNENNVVTWDYGKYGEAGGYLVKGAVSYSQYAYEPAGNKKNCNGDPINAVVVTQWAGLSIKSGKEKVLLTTLDTDDAVQVMKSYRLRTFIENCGFRELKQAADLGRLPQRKGDQAELSAYMHMILCVFAMAAFIGFLSWDENRALKAKENYRQMSQNMRDYRVEAKLNNGFVFIMVKDVYAIYETDILLEMMGMEFETD